MPHTRCLAARFLAALAVLAWMLGSIHHACAQPPDAASIGNTTWEFEARTGVLVPRFEIFLAPDGRYYSLAPSASILAYSGRYSYRVTDGNSAVLTLDTETANPKEVRLNLGSDSGTYQTPTASGTVRIWRTVVAQDVPLRNISSRATLDARQSTFVGFVVRGNARRSVLVRAVGPSLAQFSVVNPAPNPALIVWRGTTRISSNQGWNAEASISQAGAKVGAFPLLPLGRDSAVTASLPPGDYVAQVEAGEVGGEVLVEVYFIN